MAGVHQMRRTEFGETVGSAEFTFRFPDGSTKAVQLRVGRPYKVAGSESWACPCELAGFEGRHPDIHGNDSMQALCLAVSLLRRRLEDFIEKGGKVLDPSDEGECSPEGIWAAFGDVGLVRNGSAT